MDNKSETQPMPYANLRERNINDVISSITHERDVSNIPNHIKSADRRLGVFMYFRDQMNAQTIGEVQDDLLQRKVKPEVVKLWIDEKIIFVPFLLEHLKKGYPEFEMDIQKMTTDFLRGLRKK